MSRKTFSILDLLPNSEPTKGRSGTRWHKGISGYKKEDNQTRYRVKLKQRGRCPQCRKPCTPYHECEYHRRYKRIHNVILRLRKRGIVGRVERGRYQIVNLKLFQRQLLARNEQLLRVEPELMELSK